VLPCLGAGKAKERNNAPESSGPRAEIAPPRPDHSAIAFVLPGPDHSAVIKERVVGKAIPAANAPSSRAPKSTSIDGVDKR
jgi:hypothetical protein